MMKNQKCTTCGQLTDQRWNESPLCPFCQYDETGDGDFIRASVGEVTEVHKRTLEENGALHARIAELESDINRIYAATLSHVAGGSEYTGVGGIIRGINEIAERRANLWKNFKRIKGEHNALKAALKPFAEFYDVIKENDQSALDGDG